ncbi:hypothetical protein NF699_17200 [Sphingomonadaceae bacterium OTU29LAMAA1]|nr:hypothetical protein NF699_17200 [Sphingomonadaceae bacterium OTU29LAMAA1]
MSVISVAYRCFAVGAKKVVFTRRREGAKKKVVRAETRRRGDAEDVSPASAPYVIMTGYESAARKAVALFSSASPREQTFFLFAALRLRVNQPSEGGHSGTGA